MDNLKVSAMTELLDAAQRQMGLTSDRQLAKALNWLGSTISNYRCGRRAMDIEQVAEFASKTGLPVETVLKAAIEARKQVKRSRARQISLPLQVAMR